MNSAFSLISLLIPLIPPADNPTVIVVVGTPGNEEYSKTFTQSAGNWQKAAERAGAHFVRIGHEAGEPDPDEPNDGERLRQQLAELASSKSASLWLVLIGHGTYDGKRAKFNVRGPDVTGEALSQWLEPLKMRLAVINGSSASGPFINRLSGPNRVVVTATQSGAEHNFARFGEQISQTITNPQADLDKDDQVSLLEAFLLASANVQDFYKEESRLATEHALIDDNGDKVGTPADWFEGYRVTRQAKDGKVPDGSRAHQFVLVKSADDLKLSADQRQRRDDLERAIEKLRAEKSKLDEEDYYRKLEPLMVELAELYRDADKN